MSNTLVHPTTIAANARGSDEHRHAMSVAAAHFSKLGYEMADDKEGVGIQADTLEVWHNGKWQTADLSYDIDGTSVAEVAPTGKHGGHLYLVSLPSRIPMRVELNDPSLDLTVWGF